MIKSGIASVLKLMDVMDILKHAFFCVCKEHKKYVETCAGLYAVPKWNRIGIIYVKKIYILLKWLMGCIEMMVWIVYVK